MDRIRRAAVAGQWYPGDPARLTAALEQHLAAAGPAEVPQPPRALVAPHAGLVYSGPVAAHAYRAVRGVSYASVVLVGPSHFVPFRGVSIWPAGSWLTPFGPLAVDADLAAAIAAGSSEIVDLPEAHGREHSLEMQLPFVAHLLPSAPIVPLVMGRQTRATALALGEALARAIAARQSLSPDGAGVRRGDPGRVLLVASSDLSHYEDAHVAAALDAVVTARVEALDPEGLMDALEREPRHACGGGPIVSVLHAARALGASQARLLEYADSGDVSGDKSSVVGYMAAAIW